ncbi:MAG: hypothetical protein FJZ16_09315 [Candidatus Omnitrophica bacterium]|nr:hypothetical protein [Candidatus Omnitrophota bacterium]
MAKIITMVKIIGLISAIILPFWNIPLIVRIQKRRSSNDISLFWAIGVWICLVLMLPAGLITSDVVFKMFTIVNFILFSLVVIQTVRFRLRK